MTRARSTTIARTLTERWVRATRDAFRRTALPLASYYAVTLALPIANGAAQSGAFVEHALVVLIVPPVAIILACSVYTVGRALARDETTPMRRPGLSTTGASGAVAEGGSSTAPRDSWLMSGMLPQVTGALNRNDRHAFRGG